MAQKPLAIGLTGGIGSGKSTVAKLFAELGIEIIDADIIAREVVTAGSPALNKIAQHFGAGILETNGELNRSKLREKIFQEPQAKQWLEALLHPLIRTEMQQRAATAKPPYCILMIPLLLEAQATEAIDRILVVDTPVEQQITRTQKRDELSAEQVKKVLKTQINRKKRLAAADDLIYNDADIAHLKQQVAKLHQQYLTMSHDQQRE